jgi:thiamine monophosphate kinase
VPVATAVKTCFGEKALELALSGGEDYELLFTTSSKIIRKIQTYVIPVTVLARL